MQKDIMEREIAEIIKGFRQDSIEIEMNQEHVHKWISQFSPDTQNIILEETLHILKEWYFPKDKINLFLDKMMDYLKSENEKYHLEWVDGNYTTETIVAGNCTTSAIYKDTCTFCGATRNRTVEATGAHNYSYSGYDANSAKLTYTCSICNDVKSYNPTFVLAAWNVNNVNKKAADVTNGYLFELSGDGIINAKDYALIKQAVAKKSSKN